MMKVKKNDIRLYGKTPITCMRQKKVFRFISIELKIDLLSHFLEVMSEQIF